MKNKCIEFFIRPAKKIAIESIWRENVEYESNSAAAFRFNFISLFVWKIFPGSCVRLDALSALPIHIRGTGYRKFCRIRSDQWSLRSLSFSNEPQSNGSPKHIRILVLT